MGLLFHGAGFFCGKSVSNQDENRRQDTGNQTARYPEMGKPVRKTKKSGSQPSIGENSVKKIGLIRNAAP